ncbi:G3ST4 sulfotransferase, partial [Serilophus lunatus]|nr:G3ST4 sulfotransferase [Serilophus lunatus]
QKFPTPQVQKVMPNDSFYFSIVRDPSTLGESSFSSFRAAAPAFRASPNLDAFLAHPTLFYRPGIRGNHYARNLQWFDFGLPEDPKNPEEIREALENLERVFPLVLLAENFDESLVLLREALCWPEDSVDTFAHNSRNSGGVTPAQARRLRVWNHLDWELYSHLNRSFWKRAEAFGIPRLRREVSRLRE